MPGLFSIFLYSNHLPPVFPLLYCKKEQGFLCLDIEKGRRNHHFSSDFSAHFLYRYTLLLALPIRFIYLFFFFAASSLLQELQQLPSAAGTAIMPYHWYLLFLEKKFLCCCRLRIHHNRRLYMNFPLVQEPVYPLALSETGVAVGVFSGFGVTV